MKRILKGLIFLLVIFIFFLGYQFIKYQNTQVDEKERAIQAQNEADLEREVLNKQLENAQNYVDSINNDTALTILSTTGKITLSHDKTPENNGWTEWLFNSDIKVYADYNTAFTIEMNDIQTTINEDGSVTILYDERDIVLSYVDITDFTTSTNKSIFGSSYKPEQVAAFEQIARDNIIEKTDNEKNRLQAKNNFETQLKTIGKTFNTNVEVLSK